MKRFTTVMSLVFVLIMLLSTCAFAAPYTTYTYSIDGNVLVSPEAYVPYGDGPITSATLGLDQPLSNPSDIESDADGKLYIVDTGNNRIIVTNEYFETVDIINDFVNFDGVEDRFNAPQSAFVVNSGSFKGLYICDTGNGRIVVFDLETREFKRVIDAPESEFFDEEDIFRPKSCVLDKYGRIYVVSSTTTEGIVVMTSEGDFINFIGAPKVTVTALQAMLDKLGISDSTANIPLTYANIELDQMSEEFIYATIMFNEAVHDQQIADLTSKEGTYSPVRLLNADGDDIMNRNGFFSPAGEVAAAYETELTKGDISGVSEIQDISSGPNGVWSIIDSKRSKIYTYDRDGNLLHIFGDKGNQFGNIDKAGAITYQGSNILVLDTSSLSITAYRRTEYADLLDEAISLQNRREFTEAAEVWQQVLARNNNFDTAYVAIGNAYYREGEYELAKEYYMSAFDVENYAKVYKEIRAEKMEKLFIPLIIGIVVLLILIGKVFGHAAKINKKAQYKTGRRTFKEELTYGFHLMFHPFDGYWDLKHEHRGSMRASFVFIFATILAFAYQGVGQGYYYNPLGATTSFFSQASSVLLPLLLWVIANWCFTTLFDGEGSLKDIFIATSYAIYPLPVLIVISTLLSHVLVGTEGQITTIIVAIGYIWMALLLIVGMQVTHDYTSGKNILTIIATLIGMIFIMFMAMLFVSLISRMVSLVSTIISEVSFR